MNILVPQGIGDSVWALHKVQSLAAGEDINICVACRSVSHYVESRACDFIKRFDFVNSVKMYPIHGNQGPVLLPGPPADENGYYRYIPDGPTTLPDIDYVMMPNSPLERGIRLENWLPELQCNWNLMSHFKFNEKEKELSQQYAESPPYVVFFMGSEDANTTAGHNRGGLWRPEEWIDLGTRIQRELGLRIVVVGAEYDLDYYKNCIEPFVGWESVIGRYEINETFAITKQARFIISYQSGIGIVSSYLGVPTGIFWRAKGDSVHPYFYISFDEEMSSAWVNPTMIADNKHLPLIYGRHNVDYIITEVKARGW